MMTSYRRGAGARVLGLVLGLLALASACSCNRPAVPLRVGLTVWPPYELAYLAQDLGYLDDAPIHIVDYLSPAEAVRAYRNGLVDVVAVTSTFAVEFATAAGDPRMIMVIDVSEGGDALVVRSDLDDPRRLQGMRIGVEDSALGVYVLDRALTRLGLSRDDITVVPVDVADQEAAFRQGEVDAVVTFDPTRTRLLEDGAVEVFSSREIPGEIVDVLLVPAATLNERERELHVLVDGWLKAAEYLRDHPEDALARMAPRQGLSPEGIGSALEGVRIPDRAENAALLGGDEPGLLEPTRRLATKMKEIGRLPAVPAVRPLLEDRFVRRGPP